MGTLIYRNQLEVAVRVNSLHGGLAQGKRLRSKVHDRVAVVGNSWGTENTVIARLGRWVRSASEMSVL